MRLRPERFEEFYIENLPETFQARARELVARAKALEAEIIADVAALPRNGPSDDEDEGALEAETALLTQYFCPMGFKVKYHFRAMHSALAYIFPLRTASTVHPVLRRIMRGIHSELEKQFLAGGWPEMPYKAHPEPVTVDFKRGTQTIELKK